MKIKSLLLGSAAALVAVSGARAADAVIIPEPEVVEYVRVCDAAGTGYFYIPGTETCLKIGGYIRYDAGVGDLNGVDTDNDGTAETWNKNARLSVQISTYADTDMGALTTYAEFRHNYGNSAGFGDPYSVNSTTGAVTLVAPAVWSQNGYDNSSLNFAWIDLAGLRIGKGETLFTTFAGYAGAVTNDVTGGGYGGFNTNFVSYTFSSGAFTGAIALESGGGSGFQNIALIDDYMPHVVAGLGYDMGIVNLRGALAYDTRDGANQGGWAGKIRADADITDGVSAFLMLLYGENSSTYTTWRNGAVTADTLSVIGGASIGLTDTATFNTQVQWAEANGMANDEWAIAANIKYDVAPGFFVRPEVQWHRSTAGTNEWGGLIRFQRSW